MIFSRRFWLGFVISVGLVVLFQWKVDFGQTGRELKNANYAYYIPAVMIYFIAFGFRSLRWRYLLLHLKAIPPWRLYSIVSIGYLANNILPMRLGEVVRAHFVGEKEGISKASSLATIGVERVLDGLTLLLLAAIIWPFLPWTDVFKTDTGDLKIWWVALSIALALVFVVAFVALVILAMSPGLGRTLAHLLSSMMPVRLRPKVEGLINLMLEGLAALRSPRKLLVMLVLSIPVWLAEATLYYLIAISFDLDVGFHVILLVTATSNLATAVPSSIGGIGPFEVVAKATLVAFGVGTNPAAAYAFFVHIVALWLPVNILGMLFLWRENLSIAQLAKTRHMDLSRDVEAEIEGDRPSATGKPSLGLDSKSEGISDYGDREIIAGGGEGE